jgi:hypothetical protein
MLNSFPSPPQQYACSKDPDADENCDDLYADITPLSSSVSSSSDLYLQGL